MPQQPQPVVLNNFSKGYKTEFTGLSFPEDAVTSTSNCIFNRIGNVTRRLGIDYETNKTLTTIDRTALAVNSYKWNNVGGDGNTQVVVLQVGATLYFFRSSSATTASPLSGNKLASTVTLSSFVASGGSFTATKECQFADGNGYLFVFHPDMDPIYCTYNAGTISAASIDIKIRDFTGIPESGIADDFRPGTLSASHNYNILNQGWISNPGWSSTSTTSNTSATGSHTWTIATGLTITNGDTVAVTFFYPTDGRTYSETGTVTSYNSGTGSLVLNITSTTVPSGLGAITSTSWTFTHTGTSYISTFQTAYSLYPGNCDVWWVFKTATGAFTPTTTTLLATLDSGPAPKGHYLLSAFNQQRTTLSSVASLTDITTTVRPRTGTWFQGRVWYAGVDAAFAASGTAPNTTWTENIYFSQIIEKDEQFGKCYQTNDPTSETKFDLLPSDGGVARIQGCGTVHKLFPIQNGMLVFAANGVWFITGNAGIGFTANDYTIIKISAIQSISSSSFVDVRGAPIWWNEDGIYTISPGQGTEGIQYGGSRGSAINSGLQVEPITFTTIQSFYADIPLTSKKYVKGTYDPLNWEVKWTYRTTEESSVTDRYQFDGVLTYNTTTQAFSPWAIASSGSSPWVHGPIYVQSPGGSGAPDPAVKYITSVANAGSYKFTFSEEMDTNYVDWHGAGLDSDFSSYFISGYGIKGMAQHRFQTNYVYVYVKNTTNLAYRMQGIWDYATSGNSGRYSSVELTNPTMTNFAYVQNRHRVRGRGLVFQLKILSVAGAPFDITGWSIDERINQGV